MEKNLKRILDNPKGHLIAIDMDGTLCKGRCWTRDEMFNTLPNRKFIKKVLEWYLKGAFIVVYTARPPRFYSITMAWLVRHHIPFHGICMQMKPNASVYIDDKNVNVKEVTNESR